MTHLAKVKRVEARVQGTAHHRAQRLPLDAFSNHTWPASTP